MYCPNYGKQIPDESNFCMYCGVELEKLKSQINFSPTIEVSPKIEAKAEGMPVPKWKPKPVLTIDGYPVYEKFAEFQEKFFCPECGNYDSLSLRRAYSNIYGNTAYICDIYYCHACDKSVLKLLHKVGVKGVFAYLKGNYYDRKLPIILPAFEKKLYEIYFKNKNLRICPHCGGKIDWYKEKEIVGYVTDPEYERGYGEVYYALPLFKMWQCENKHEILVLSGITHKSYRSYGEKIVPKDTLCGLCHRDVAKYYCETCKIIICSQCSKGIFRRSCPNCGTGVRRIYIGYKDYGLQP